MARERIWLRMCLATVKNCATTRMGIGKLNGYGGFQTDLPDGGNEERVGGW